MHRRFISDENTVENDCFMWFYSETRPGFFTVRPLGLSNFSILSYAVIDDFGNLVPVP